jgi:hypothetical protein
MARQRAIFNSDGKERRWIMRYHCTSWNDINLAIEAFTYARRALLVVLAIALPFAAWDSAHPKEARTATEDTVQVWTIQPVQAIEPAQAAEPAESLRT